MSKSEEEYLLEQHPSDVKPFFEAPDRKILATGDMFRGPYTGISSDMDLNNPGKKLMTSEDKLEEDIRRGRI
ncbi:hypothetical protein [Niallia sp. NCCP-28]|uniref:hypothetical protein n=1 Tax=Niallia sp. NCCP-28 TaxID=2934712 RepID=UPI002080AC79|nr:hypothetical protein [Niallia sp. NCCP-28]GKU84782.1 hypothetical protein NCCP28_41780 [Niallia sp. NCCP-28]